MEFLLPFLQWICLVPVIGGAAFAVLCVPVFLRFTRRPASGQKSFFQEWPGVTLLKPVRGLEKDQKATLRSSCLQDYPDFQVVFAAQDRNDPVVPLLREIQEEFGPGKVSVVIEDFQAGPNGKINNLIGALRHARNDLLVISDSDVFLRPDYLRTIIAPLADSEVGFVCTLYRITGAERWFEKMELLTFNADFTPGVVFAHLTGASKFCLGASLAMRRDSLEEMGGLESLADYLVEDYEMGRRIWSAGKRGVLVPYFVDIVVDFENALQWWNHQVYWDQNTRVAQPGGFFASIVTRSVPFSLFFAMLRSADAVGLLVLTGAVTVRMITAAVVMRCGLGDREGLRSLLLLPFRDTAALASWLLSFTKRTVIWRGSEFDLTKDGRLRPKESGSRNE
ncbi:MAG: bacteriohopanetetrol glucosamine biosynthesis glycosyltransferase HpnI [Nitrospirae bacterium]|nr:bacteriohopanetetrol glucosamine biosynthesis glycosyltransferase HpnI [Nitrospirota bacterium]